MIDRWFEAYLTDELSNNITTISHWLDIDWPKVKISSFCTRFYLVMSILFMYVLCFYILIPIFKLSRIQNGAPCSEHAVGSWVEDPPLGPPSVQQWAEPMHHVTCAACKAELKPRDQEVVPSGRWSPELTSSHQWSWRVHWWKMKRSFLSGSEKKTKSCFLKLDAGRRECSNVSAALWSNSNLQL